MYSGRIESYSTSDQQLSLKFFSQVDEFSAAFVVRFSAVHYIDLPASWKGATIHSASEESCWELLTQVLGPAVAKHDMLTKNGLLEDFRLYTIHVRQINYRILATNTIELLAP
jgi:hypothetical protein